MELGKLLCALIVLPNTGLAVGDMILSFNTSEQTGLHFIAHIGDTVTLTCIPQGKHIRYVNIYKGSGSDEIILMKDGKISNQRYTLEKKKSGTVYNLIFTNVTDSDTSIYWCRYERWYWYKIWKWFWVDQKEHVYLKVTQQNYTIDFCTLMNGVGGLFFTGDTLILKCPRENELEIKVHNQNIEKFYNQDMDNFTKVDSNGQGAITLTENVSELFNNSRLYCLSASKKTDFCRFLPNLTIYNSVQAELMQPKITIGQSSIPNGGNVTFTCFAYPHSSMTLFQWEISGIGFDNISVSETHNASFLEISNINFSNVTNGKVIVECTVIIGEKNATASASVEVDDQDMEQVSQNSSVQLVLIAIVISVVLMLTLSACTVYRWKLRNCKLQGGPASTGNGGVGGNNQMSEMGLSPDDGEVANNIVYEPYSRDNNYTK